MVPFVGPRHAGFPFHRTRIPKILNLLTYFHGPSFDVRAQLPSAPSLRHPAIDPRKIRLSRARSSVGERSLHTREVAGSKPAVPIARRPHQDWDCGFDPDSRFVSETTKLSRGVNQQRVESSLGETPAVAQALAPRQSATKFGQDWARTAGGVRDQAAVNGCCRSA